MTARIEPLPPKQWPSEMRWALEPLASAGRRHPSPPRDDPTSGVAALGVFAHHPQLARAFTTFNGHILWDTSLTPRLRQLAILRVVDRRHASYLWREHSRSSLAAGLDAEEVERVHLGPGAPEWCRLEGAVLRAVDELVDDGCIADETWSVLAAELDVEQLADLVCTVGCYETNSMLLRSFGVEAEPETDTPDAG
ncbi:MAG: carboxymuconolactone decarboxylase family protein [Acidimicrobiia bacterium]